LDPTTGESYTPEEKKKIRDLERALREKEEELRFLKKAAAFFARNQP
jgi:transposase-like protein